MSKKNIHIDELAKKAYDGFELAPISENWDAISNALSSTDLSLNQISKQAYDGFEIPPMPNNWDAISAALDNDNKKGAYPISDDDENKKKGGLIPWFKIIASALLIIGVFLLGNQIKNYNKKTITPIIVDDKNKMDNNIADNDLIKSEENINSNKIEESNEIDNNHNSQRTIKEDYNPLNNSAVKDKISKDRNIKDIKPIISKTDNNIGNKNNKKIEFKKEPLLPTQDTKNHKPLKNEGNKLKPIEGSSIVDNSDLGQINLNPNKGLTQLNILETEPINQRFNQLPKIESPYQIRSKITPYVSLGINYGMVNNVPTFTNTNVNENNHRSTALPNIDFKLGIEYGKWQVYSGISSNSFSYTTNMNHLLEIYDSFPVLNQRGDTTHWLQKNWRDTAQMTPFNNNMRFVTIPVGVKYNVNLDATHRNKLALGLATELAVPTNFSAFGTDNKGYLVTLNKNNLKQFNPLFNINIEYNRAINKNIGVYFGLEHKFSAGNIYNKSTPYNEKLRKTMISTGLKIKF